MELAPAKTTPPSMPLFYTRPELLVPDRHAGRSLARRLNYGFAKRTNSVPLNGIEFAVAQRNFPIVFSNETSPFPVAVLGLRNEENQFVGAAGDWMAGAYVPAYVRRYPFIFMTGNNDNRYALCIDAASPLVIEGEENPLFKDGQPTDLAKNALNFCGAFQAQYDQTRAFAAALTERNLLDLKNADMKAPDGQAMQFGPFRVVDETKLAALPADIVVDWHKKGWLAWINAHLFSFANWATLVSRTQAPAAGEGVVR